MEHVAGLPSSASTRTSLGAFALAVLLHIAAAAALWWITVNRPILAPVEEAIEVTIEQPKPPDPPPPEPPKPQPPPQPQVQPKPKPMPPMQGLAPPAEITADRRTQVPPSGDRPKDIAGPSPRSPDAPVPEPPPPTQAAAAEPPKPKEPPPLEQAVPQPPPPAPAIASLPPPKEPSPAAPKPPAVAAATPVPPRSQAAPAVTPHAEPRVAPQVARPQLRPPAVAHRDTPPSSSPFVNPADVRNRALASENYLWQNARKFTFPIEEVRRGYFVKVRVVIARDGRLVSADVAQSNGTPAMDQAILAGVRRNSPYLPLPPEIAGNQATFDVPLANF